MNENLSPADYAPNCSWSKQGQHARSCRPQLELFRRDDNSALRGGAWPLTSPRFGFSNRGSLAIAKSVFRFCGSHLAARLVAVLHRPVGTSPSFSSFWVLQRSILAYDCGYRPILTF